MTERWTADEAFALLSRPVHGYLRAAGDLDADDVFGDVFLAVTSRIDSFEGDERALRSWVFTIAHHRVVDARRRARRWSLLPRRRHDEVPAPDDPFDPALVRALEQLTAEQREVIVLRFVADLSLETVAELVGRDVGAVKALQHRGLARLATELSRVSEA